MNVMYSMSRTERETGKGSWTETKKKKWEEYTKSKNLTSRNRERKRSSVMKWD